jgi:hypothetical protein
MTQHEQGLTIGNVECAVSVYETISEKSNNFIYQYILTHCIKAHKSDLSRDIDLSMRYYDYIISNSTNTTKSTWDIVRKLTNKSRHNNKITSIKIKDKLINDTGIIANSFNSYFSTIAQTSHKDIPDKNYVWGSLQSLNHNMLEQIEPLHFEPTSINEINKIIKSLKIKDSYGYDEISTRILKISAQFIASPLTFICNQILNAGIFPDRMKLSIIKPLLKNRQQQRTKELSTHITAHHLFQSNRQGYL